MRITLFSCLFGALLMGCSPSAEHRNSAVDNNKNCGSNETYLPHTGLCSDKAETLIQHAGTEKSSFLLIDGCSWSVNETVFPDGDEVLLYQALKCGNHTAKLGLAAGAKRADLFIETSAIDSTQGEEAIIASIYGLADEPVQTPVFHARQHLETMGLKPSYIHQCQSRPSSRDGADAYVVDIFTSDEAEALFDDEPRSDCGDLGYTEESYRYWRLAYDYAWFIDLGQDGYQEIDPNSFTLISKTKDGEWAATRDLITYSLDQYNYGVTNIVENANSVEVDFGSVENWLLVEGTLKGNTAYCAAEKQFGDRTLRIGTDGGQWQIATNYESSPNYIGAIEIDDKILTMSGTSTSHWTIGWIGQPEIDGIRNSTTIILDINRASLDFKMDGIANALDQVNACLPKAYNPSPE